MTILMDGKRLETECAREKAILQVVLNNSSRVTDAQTIKARGTKGG